MKNSKLIIVALFTFFYLNANSQIFVGGNIRLNTTNSKSTENFSSHNIGISPDIGKYISDKLALGVSLNFSSQENRSAGVTGFKNSSIGFNPFLKYYFLKLEKFSIFGQGNIGLEFGKVKQNQNSDEIKRIRTYINFNPGLSYDLTNHLSLQTSLYFLSFGYDYITTDESPKQKTSMFSLNSSLDYILSLELLNIGAIYKF